MAQYHVRLAVAGNRPMAVLSSRGACAECCPAAGCVWTHAIVLLCATLVLVRRAGLFADAQRHQHPGYVSDLAVGAADPVSTVPVVW